ncbi:MAG: FixH family protein [Methylocystaceae bacterium]|nr:FixH family protein [Methylocystaceae bacterium]
MSTERKPGWWYPWIFVGFFAVIITVNGIMMYFAHESWTGLETKDYYLKGLAYDKNVAGAKAQEALGWDVTLEVKTLDSSEKHHKVAYKVIFLDHNGKPVESLKAHTFFLRPTSEGMDVDEPAKVVEPGVLAGEVVLAAPGQWNVRVHAESLGRQYQLVDRVLVR